MIRGAPYSVALLCILSGCAVGPDFHRPSAPPVTHYANGADPTITANADGTAQRFSPGSDLSSDWWHLFHSSKLDAVITEGMANNPGLSAAQASLRASQDNLRSGYGIFYPAIDADAAGTRERYSPVGLGGNGGGSIFNLFTLSASVNYALDLFGGQRRLVESLHAQVDIAGASERATYLTLAANIVNTMIAQAAYQAEVDATRQLIDLERQQVQLAQIQSNAGTVPYSNVLGLRSQLASSEATIPSLEQKLTQSDDLLASLAGRTPAEWKAPEVGLQDLTLPC
jgi:NodT family efflux transporter outer membrane factor (OMF) lipoprotein